MVCLGREIRSHARPAPPRSSTNNPRDTSSMHTPWQSPSWTAVDQHATLCTHAAQGGSSRILRHMHG
eukprot:7378906-Prymnesium_polylepis.1